EQRIAIAAIAEAEHVLLRECAPPSDFDDWSGRRQAAHAAMETLLSKLTIAKLLVHDATLQKGLEEVEDAWDAVDNAMDQMDNADQESAIQKAIEGLNDA